MDDLTWVEEYNGRLLTPTPTSTKRRWRPKRLEFVGWGSRQLVEFLESIGKDAAKKISQYDVTDIINKYVSDNKLHHPTKKKRIACDDRLLALFGRKIISRIKIYDLLEPHYAENRDDSDFDFLYSSDEDEKKSVNAERKANTNTSSKKKVKQAPKSCFAAVVSDNIKLVYLKRSLVEELAKENETFQGKVVGSFVRIKSDPNDYLQKNPYMLAQVTGVKKADGTNDFLLQVSNCVKDVRISMLSDENFSKEECEDLQRRIKDGSLKRLTVVELEEKAQALHEDVTKHWLAGELVSLQRLIDRANEKGWRRELFEYLEKRELLQKPEEQSRLLREVPEVIAEEPEAATKEPPDDEEQGENGSHISCLQPVPGISRLPNDKELRENGSQVSCLKPATEIPKLPNNREQRGNGSQISSVQPIPETPKLPFDKEQRQNGLTPSLPAAWEIPTHDATANGRLPSWISFGRHSADDKCGLHILEHSKQDDKSGPHILDSSKQGKEAVHENNDDKVLLSAEKTAVVSQAAMNKPVIDLNEGFQVSFNGLVIELSDDEETEDQTGGHQVQQYADQDITILMWHYRDPQGYVQGPFSLSSLKLWSDADYFPPEFKVWKTGQNQEQAVLLNDILYRVFPC